MTTVPQFLPCIAWNIFGIGLISTSLDGSKRINRVGRHELQISASVCRDICGSEKTSVQIFLHWTSLEFFHDPKGSRKGAVGWFVWSRAKIWQKNTNMHEDSQFLGLDHQPVRSAAIQKTFHNGAGTHHIYTWSWNSWMKLSSYMSRPETLKQCWQIYSITI